MTTTTFVDGTTVIVAAWLNDVNALTYNARTGSGNLVFGTSPVLVTPALGTPASGILTNCTFPTLNQNTSGTAAGLSVTLVPASGGTGVANNNSSTITISGAFGFTLTLAGAAGISLASGKTPVFSNSITFAGTDATTMTFPPASASLGYLGTPQNSQSTAYTTVLADAGKTLFHPASDATPRTFTIDSNANVAYPIGTLIGFNNRSASAMTLAITSDTLTWYPSGGTGSRTIAQYGKGIAEKIGATEWALTGVGIT